MGSEKFTVMVTYGQISVFREKIEFPFSDWLQGHVDQGFAWREGSVSFRTLYESGEHLVELIVVSEEPDLDSATVRSIKVPFEVHADEGVEVASISDSISLTLPAGLYNLRCDFFNEKPDESFLAKLIFIKSNAPKFEVVRADSEILVRENFLLDARPA